MTAVVSLILFSVCRRRPLIFWKTAKMSSATLSSRRCTSLTRSTNARLHKKGVLSGWSREEAKDSPSRKPNEALRISHPARNEAKDIIEHALIRGCGVVSEGLA